ncbi:MAG: hypothetical protein K8S54_10790 [Spirochaetia bacterium]|nr:hypothetical protein [Spirochaetia bacterium]
MNHKGILVSTLITALAFLSFCGKPQTGGEDKDNPHRTASEAVLRAKTLTISVQVPAGHHAYLDPGKDGTFIPISFQWDELLKEIGLTKAPGMKTGPSGEPEAESGAKVLRGKGDFVFEGELDKLAGKTIQIRSQICDDVKGICYRPSIQAVEIQKL